MEQSGVVGFNADGNAQRVTDFHDSPFLLSAGFCRNDRFDDISPEVVWLGRAKKGQTYFSWEITLSPSKQNSSIRCAASSEPKNLMSEAVLDLSSRPIPSI